MPEAITNQPQTGRDDVAGTLITIINISRIQQLLPMAVEMMKIGAVEVKGPIMRTMSSPKLFYRI